MNVYVTNTGTEPHEDNFCGKTYKFWPGKTFEVPVEVARNLLGYEQEDKQWVIARLGWARTANDMPQALERLAKLQITQEPPQDRLLASAVGVVPLPPARRGGRNAGAQAA